MKSKTSYLVTQRMHSSKSQIRSSTRPPGSRISSPQTTMRRCHTSFSTKPPTILTSTIRLLLLLNISRFTTNMSTLPTRYSSMIPMRPQWILYLHRNRCWKWLMTICRRWGWRIMCRLCSRRSACRGRLCCTLKIKSC